LPNTLDISFTIRTFGLIPYSRKALLFGVQKTIIAGYGDALLASKQGLNKDVEALIHSGHDENNLYVQFRLGEKEDGRAVTPESLVQSATDCKLRLENLYSRPIKAEGRLRRCSDSVEKLEL
jgi:hypothetical protein